MKKRLLICWFASAVACAFSAQAQTIFERATITLQPAPIESQDASQPPLPAREPVVYEIELRSEEALRLEYIHALNSLTATNGVMITLTKPQHLALPALRVYTPVDVLFIAADGRVLQILPNITLGEMSETVEAAEPVKAFLFLKAGQAAARAIHPRDRVIGAVFAAPLPIQQ